MELINEPHHFFTCSVYTNTLENVTKVANKLSVLQIAQNTYFGSQHSKVRRSVYRLVEFQHLLERKVAAHVGVHDKKQVGISSEYLIAEVVHATSCAQCIVLLQVPV